MTSCSRGERCSHFVGGGEVDPELQALGRAGAGGHLGVHDAAAGRHPLHVAGLDRATVALEVLVRHRALKAAFHAQGEKSLNQNSATHNYSPTLILSTRVHSSHSGQGYGYQLTYDSFYTNTGLAGQ
jgi:hypothetical protein